MGALCFADLEAVCAAINWARRGREAGSIGPCQIGCHKPKASLRGFVAELAARGLRVDHRSGAEFVDAKKLRARLLPRSIERLPPELPLGWCAYLPPRRRAPCPAQASPLRASLGPRSSAPMASLTVWISWLLRCRPRQRVGQPTPLSFELNNA
jgi:hypothetical protein